MNPDVHIGVEYKFTISPDEEFNHPLIVAEHIVCWDMEIPEEGSKIRDSYDYFGTTSSSKDLEGIGYVITDIESRSGQFHNQDINVVSLKKLISKTFECKWTTPPSKLDSIQSKKRK